MSNYFKGTCSCKATVLYISYMFQILPSHNLIDAARLHSSS